MMKSVQPPSVYGERIIHVCTNFSYVFDDENLLEAARSLSESKTSACAVVTRDLKVIGLVRTAEILELLGKPFGRDLLSRKSIGEVSKKARNFLFNEHIQEIAGIIQDDFLQENMQYYILFDSKRTYCGVFSSRDLLVYSAKTQQRDLELACGIQDRIVPRYSHFEGKRCSFVCTALMSQSVGGDYYHIKEYSPRRWFFCLCDISGKGVSAAIITAFLSGFMTNLDCSSSLDSIIGSLNNVILSTFSLQKYLTGLFIQFDENTGRLDWCDMGHGLLHIMRDGQLIPCLPQNGTEAAGSMPVGVMENPSIESYSVFLVPEDILVLYTDGLTEQKNLDGSEYDIERVKPLISAAQGDLKKAKISLFEDFASFKGSAVQHDDISCILMRFV